MIADVVGEFCRSKRLSSRLLSLGPVDDRQREGPVQRLGGSRGKLALAVWRRQMGGDAALIFDHPGPARLQAFVPRRLRAPYLVFLYGIDVWRKQTWTGNRSLRAADSIIAISEFTKRRAYESIPGLTGIHVLHPALEERVPAGSADPQVVGRAGTGYLLIVGRMSTRERYKGHDPLLEALPEMLRRHPEARLVIVGDGDDRPRLEARAQELGLRDSIYFTGFIDEATLAELYQNALAFVMPSSEEGFGLVYLEAMRAERACIAARGSAAEEIVVDGETGLLVRPERSQDIADACLRLLLDPDLARELGGNGHRRWRETFRRCNFQRRLNSHLDDLLTVRNVRD